MTHPTDKELDALVAAINHSTRDPETGDDLYPGVYVHLAVEDAIAASVAITTLRAQLAEAKTEKEKLGRELNLARYGQPDFSWQVHKEALAEARARADRAEAALAAQIQADAGIADLCKRQNGPLSLKGQDPYIQGLSSAGQAIAAAIRAQPHDRTALDRMLAEAREKAMREAAGMFDADSNIAQTILALIDSHDQR